LASTCSRPSPHVRQAEKAGREFLARLARQAPLLPGGDVLAFVDIDSTQKRVYGHKKRERKFLPGHDRRAIHERIARLRGDMLTFIEWLAASTDVRQAIVASLLRRGKLVGVAVIVVVCRAKKEDLPRIVHALMRTRIPSPATYADASGRARRAVKSLQAVISAWSTAPCCPASATQNQHKPRTQAMINTAATAATPAELLASLVAALPSALPTTILRRVGHRRRATIFTRRICSGWCLLPHGEKVSTSR
jgi:hypothetical protein